MTDFPVEIVHETDETDPLTHSRQACGIATGSGKRFLNIIYMIGELIPSDEVACLV